MTLALIALGSNWDEPQKRLAQALDALAGLPHTQVTASSGVYRTEPLDVPGGDFANAVCAIETLLNAYDLLAHLQRLEQEAGRPSPAQRANQSAQARTLDLDILFYGDGQISSPNLTVPHPRWRQRAFVLVPLCDIAPHLVNPLDLERVKVQQTSLWR